MNQGRRDYKSSSQRRHRVYFAFERQANATPDRCAISYGDCQISYRELHGRASMLGRYLGSLDIKSGDRVALCLERSPDLVVALLGILKADCCYVPIDSANPRERIAQIVDSAQVRVVLCSQLSVDCLSGLDPAVICLDRDWPAIAALRGEAPIRSDNRLDALIYCIFTSGSTGRPKGAGIYHRGFSNLLWWYTQCFGMDSDERVLLLSSIGFDLTQKNIFAPLAVGATLVIPDLPSNDPLYLQEVIARERVSWLNCAPSMFYLLLESQRSHCALRSLRYVFLGGEPINAKRLESWLAQSTCRIVNTYGPTECTDIATSYQVERISDFRQRKIPIGRPIPGVQVFVLDERGRQVPIGTAGELCIAGIGVGAGYLGEPEQTAEKFFDCPPLLNGPSGGGKLYRTGDLVRCLDSGELEFIDRLDHQVKVNGVRVELGEIEAALMALPAVKQAVVVVGGRAESGSLVAHVVPERAAQAEPSVLRSGLADRLPDAMIPSAFVFVDRFALNASGKIDRQALAASSRVRPSIAQRFCPPRDALESDLADLWSQLLGIDRVGVDDRFFELGGTSVLAAQFITRLNGSLGGNIPVVAVFNAPTVAQVAAVLRRDFGPLLTARYGTGSMNVDTTGSVSAQLHSRAEQRDAKQKQLRARRRMRREMGSSR